MTHGSGPIPLHAETERPWEGPPIGVRGLSRVSALVLAAYLASAPYGRTAVTNIMSHVFRQVEDVVFEAQERCLVLEGDRRSSSQRGLYRLGLIPFGNSLIANKQSLLRVYPSSRVSALRMC
jgi:hypothetical protein